MNDHRDDHICKRCWLKISTMPPQRSKYKYLYWHPSSNTWVIQRHGWGFVGSSPCEETLAVLAAKKFKVAVASPK